jgi:hypothetical protein
VHTNVVVVVLVLLLVDVEVLVLVLVELLVVLVVGAAVVLVLVVVDVLLVVVVVGSTFTCTLIKFVHTPTDCTLIVVVPSGTNRAVYPACKAAADTFVANGATYPSRFE